MIFETMYDQSDIEYEIEWAISSEKRSKKMTDLKEMGDRILQPGSEISLSDVANELPSAGVAQDKIRLDIDQFREQLAFSINNHDIVLEKQVFPKRKRPSDINISVTGKQDLQWSLESRNSAASIVSFVREFTAWIPTYIQVEEEIRVKEKQKSIACQMATTMLEENVGCVLKEKGYTLKNAMAADLFPRCAHVESIVTLIGQEV